MSSLASLSLFFFAISVVVNILLAFFVYVRNPKSATNKIFGLLGIVISIWLIVFYLSLLPNPDPLINLWEIRLSIFFAVLMSALFLLFAKTLPADKVQARKRGMVTIGTFTLFVMVVTLSPYAFTSIEIKNATPTPLPGPGIVPFLASVILLNAAAIYELIKKLRSSTGLQKLQYRYVMVGMLLMHGFIITTVTIPVVVFQNTTFLFLSPVYTLFFLILTGYAIVRHRLLDIRFIVIRTVSYSFLTLSIATILTIYLFVIGTVFLNISFTVEQQIVLGILVLLLIFSFSKIEKLIESGTSQIFFKGRYDTEDVLQEISTTMAFKIEIDELAHDVLQKLLSEMKINHGVCILYSHYRVLAVMHEGYRQFPEVDEFNLYKLAQSRETILYDEVDSLAMKDIMRFYGFRIVLPLRTKGELIGILALGDKLSGEIYSDEDIEMLEILAPQLAVAVKNALSYQEIKRFSITLQEEVTNATKDLTAANEKLKEVDKLKDEFVSLASHELRTPMTAIKSYLWMALAGKGGELSEKQKYYLDRAYNSTDRLIRMVNDMLNISRIESGRVYIDVKEVDIVQLSKEVLEEVYPRAQELQVKLQLLPSSSVPHVMADPDKVKEVLLNLIGNSIKFTPPNGIVSVSFKVDTMVEVQVSDTGAGIAPDDMPKLFHKFGLLQGSYVVNKTTTQGTGLGLYISKSIIEMHGGVITASSLGVGKGSTFTFTLPIFSSALLQKYKKDHPSNSETIGLVPTQI